jgi:hypothetical protein
MFNLIYLIAWVAGVIYGAARFLFGLLAGMVGLVMILAAMAAFSVSYVSAFIMFSAGALLMTLVRIR